MKNGIIAFVVGIALPLLFSSLHAQITFERCYGGTDFDRGTSVQETQDGGYIVAGWTRSFGAGSGDVYLIKTDSLGIGILEDVDKRPETRNMRLIVTPIPFTSVTNLQLVGFAGEQNANLHIYDTAGRLVKTIKPATSTYQLGADLVPGVYFLKLNGKPVGKVVKVR